MIFDDSEPTKYCPDCRQDLPVSQFQKDPRRKDGLGFYCKPCHNRIARENKEKNGGARNYHLRRRYGITAEHFDAMFAEQGGLRAIAYLGRDLATPIAELPTFHVGVHVGDFSDPRPPDEPRAA